MPVASELLRLWAPLCRAGDPALDGGSRAPSRGWAQPFHLLVTPKLEETGPPGRPRGPETW